MIKYNIDRLIREVRYKNQIDLPVTEFAQGTGFSRPFVTSLINSDGRSELEVLQRLLAYFRDHGLDITVADLFEEIEDAPQENGA